jgi:hypothetical protein
VRFELAASASRLSEARAFGVNDRAIAEVIGALRTSSNQARPVLLVIDARRRHPDESEAPRQPSGPRARS